MPTVRLTQAAWLARETERARGVLLQNLDRIGVDQADLVNVLRDKGIANDWSAQDLLDVRDALIADGTIELAGGEAMGMSEPSVLDANGAPLIIDSQEQPEPSVYVRLGDWFKRQVRHDGQRLRDGTRGPGRDQ